MKILNHPLAITGIKMGKFLLAGVPSFLVAIPTNIFLVDHCHLPVPLAYAFVLILQVSANFFMCRWFVFKNRKETPFWVQFGQFFSGILFFRLGDWILYSLLTGILSIHYIVIQISNTILFFALKYFFAKKVMED